jgi:hypothetical protein
MRTSVGFKLLTTIKETQIRERSKKNFSLKLFINKAQTESILPGTDLNLW